MSSVIKVNACVYSRIGYGRTDNTSSFYMNGKFTSENHIDNVQASMENRGQEYLFAVADNMICDYPEQEMNVSILKEVGRFHEKITVNGGDIRSKIKELESRLNDTERLLTGFMEMGRMPLTDTSWNSGFSGLLISDGKFVAVTQGNGRIFMMRDGMFRPLASETSRAKRAIDRMRNLDIQESDDVDVPGEESDGSAVVSDIYDIKEGDSFLLLSDALFEALGEEKIEDLLALRSDSSYISYRLVDEAMKRKSNGDITAMVVQVERVSASPTSARRVASRQRSQQKVKRGVDRLNKAPAVAYKYSKRNSRKYQSIIFVVMVIVTVLMLFGLLYLIISSLINTGKNLPKEPPPTSATATPDGNGHTDFPTVEPTETYEPEEDIPTPTPEPEIIEHKVVKGENISAIARKYYGDTSLVKKLCEYNGISDPNKIMAGQIIKIPPKEMLVGE